MHELREGIDIVSFNLSMRATRESAWQFVCEREFLEYVDRRGCNLGFRSLAGRKLQLVEQNHRELLGELMLNDSPASSKIFALRDASSASMRVDWLASAA